MAAMREQAREPEEWELIITRVFDTPRDFVFRAWTEPERFMRWWGPKGFTTPVARMDVRVGGENLTCMRSPEGQDYWSKGVYREIVPPERLVMTDSFADEQGSTVPASYYGMSEEWPLEMLVTVTFEEEDSKTKLTLKHSGIGGMSVSDRRDMEQGWSESFDKLAETLKERSKSETQFIAKPGSHEIVITRIFNAPRERLFNIFTDPALIPEWWGPKTFTTIVDKMEVRPGGMWRFTQRDADGNEYAFKGVYHDVSSPERIISTFEYEGEPGHVMLETVTFEDLDGTTKATDRVVFQTVEDRDAALQSGMEGGAVESMERMAELVAKRGEFRTAA